MNGIRFLVTAGPTREPIDPVRFISNRSSGKMGYAVASCASARGHAVILVTGPVSIDPPSGVEVVRVETAEQMNAAVRKAFRRCDCLIMAAAVADYRPARPSRHKLKKGSAGLNLDLVRTPDILEGLKPLKAGRIVVGFAVETRDLLENAAGKLRRKGLDMIVANSAEAFDSEDSAVHFITPEGRVETFRRRPKSATALAIIQRVEAEFARRSQKR